MASHLEPFQVIDKISTYSSRWLASGEEQNQTWEAVETELRQEEDVETKFKIKFSYQNVIKGLNIGPEQISRKMWRQMVRSYDSGSNLLSLYMLIFPSFRTFINIKLQ